MLAKNFETKSLTQLVHSSSKYIQAEPDQNILKFLPLFRFDSKSLAPVIKYTSSVPPSP